MRSVLLFLVIGVPGMLFRFLPRRYVRVVVLVAAVLFLVGGVAVYNVDPKVVAITSVSVDGGTATATYGTISCGSEFDSFPGPFAGVRASDFAILEQGQACEPARQLRHIVGLCFGLIGYFGLLMTWAMGRTGRRRDEPQVDIDEVRRSVAVTR